MVRKKSGVDDSSGRSCKMGKRGAEELSLLKNAGKKVNSAPSLVNRKSSLCSWKKKKKKRPCRGGPIKLGRGERRRGEKERR